MSFTRALPEVSVKDLIVWDDARSQCCGFLNKKTSKNSTFLKGTWQKRWFLIDVDIEENGNYSLQYFHSPDDKTPRQVFPLARVTIKVAGGNAFILSLDDEVLVTLSADNHSQTKMWVDTLENVISVANLRARLLKEYDENFEESAGDDTNKRSRYSLMRGEMAGISSIGKGKVKKSTTEQSPGRSPSKKPSSPAVRLDVDAETIPPTSKARHQFLQLFIDDVSKALEIIPDMVEVLSVKPAPGMDWLTMIEFDINPISLLQNEAGDHNDPNYWHRLETERVDIRSKLLWTLHEMIGDPASVLYNGFVTSKLDPSFSANMLEVSEDDDEIVPYSTDPEVLRIMEQYKDTHVPHNAADYTHFAIELHFEDKVKVVHVPNPLVLRKRCCVLWPFEVKQALGFMGNMQELWIEPIALIPKNMPKLLSNPIPFKPSVRYGGECVIAATHLKADQAYEVSCEDKRDEALNSLSPEEMEIIKATFQQCDLNGDGGISRAEMSELVRRRTADRKAIIEEKFEAFLSEPGITREEIASAESNKATLMQSMHEAQNKLMKMFEAADVNGDGVISFTEFIMAEAWWMRCTINPERAHLF